MNHIPGLTIIHNWIGPFQEETLVECVDKLPWDDVLKRRTQQYGYRYDYLTGSLSPAPPIPLLIDAIGARLVKEGYFESRPDQVIVNEYLPGQSDAYHVDSVECFGPVVASLSLVESGYLAMNRLVRVEDDGTEVYDGGYGDFNNLTAKSLLVLSGPAHYDWRHSVSMKRMRQGGICSVKPSPNADNLFGEMPPTERRISITFRTVNR